MCHPVHINSQKDNEWYVLGLEIILARGLAKFVPAVAYHFCLNLPATFPQPHTQVLFPGPVHLFVCRAMEIQFKASRLFTFAVEPDLPLAPEYDGHPLADVVEVQDAQQLVHLLLRKRPRKDVSGNPR